MHGEHSSSGRWTTSSFDAGSLRSWVRDLHQRMRRAPAQLALVFIPPRLFDAAPEILAAVREETGVEHLLGASANSVIAGGEEFEDSLSMSLGLYSLPGATLQTVHFSQRQVEEWNGGGYWHLESRQTAETVNSWLVFADPFSLDSDRWLRQWNDAFPGIPTLGGLASGDYSERRIQLYQDGRVHSEGGVALAVSGRVRIKGMISQGCTPIGETWTITRAEQNVVWEIGNRPAYEVLYETLESLSPAQRELSRGNLFAGLAISEYRDEFERGDFLVRNILDADAEAGAITLGAAPRAGQTLQFQRRDAAASREDMTVMLRRAQNDLSGRKVYGGCLCSCNGRGAGLFGEAHHDASKVQEAFGPLGLAGFFCNGELGPVGGETFLHGYTASLALFVDAPEDLTSSF